LTSLSCLLYTLATIMEETNQEEAVKVQEENTSPAAPEVGFPLSQPKPKGKSNKWIFIVIGLLILGGGGIYFFTRGANEEETLPSSTIDGVATSTPAPTPTLNPADKKDVSIEVENGTGISGEAAYLQGVLKNLGYSDIEVGNSESTDNTKTTVTFGRSVSQAIKDEITNKLEEVYQDVDVKTSSTQSVDVLIVTGLRKGATAKPSPTASPRPTVSPTASPSASPTTSPIP